MPDVDSLRVDLPSPAGLAWRRARADEGGAIAELRADVLRVALERLGRFDDVLVRRYFLAAFVPGNTQVLEGPQGIVGSVALRASSGATWIEHFYLHSSLQGHGHGTAILRAVTDAADASATTLRLSVLRASDARRLYERQGFRLERHDDVDDYLRRAPRLASASTGSSRTSPGGQ